MKNAIVYEADDLKSLLAERHDVPLKNVIRNQYSYTVVLGDVTEENKEPEDISD